MGCGVIVRAEGGRAKYPEMRRERHAGRERSAWDETLDYMAGRFARIIEEHGPDAVAFYVSGQRLTEDYYVFNKPTSRSSTACCTRCSGNGSWVSPATHAPSGFVLSGRVVCQCRNVSEAEIVATLGGCA
jgi:anaerobic selenocysteine-containing dehydrogenase